MAKTWAVSFGEPERMELERIMLDRDPEAALAFLENIVYAKIKDSEKPGGCFHDPSKPVESLGRPVDTHKKLGSF
jgi:hypothetical protein